MSNTLKVLTTFVCLFFFNSIHASIDYSIEKEFSNLKTYFEERIIDVGCGINPQFGNPTCGDGSGTEWCVEITMRTFGGDCVQTGAWTADNGLSGEFDVPFELCSPLGVDIDFNVTHDPVQNPDYFSQAHHFALEQVDCPFPCTLVGELGPAAVMICEGESYELDPVITGQYDCGDAVTYNWSTGETTPTITVTPPTLNQEVYRLTVTDCNGCTDVDVVTLRMYPTATISATATCDADNLNYTIDVTTTNTTIFNTFPGTVSGTGPNYTVSVPAGSNTNLTANNEDGCFAFEQIISPICGCQVDTPQGTGVQLCGAGDANLSATAGANCDEIRWYTSASGGTPVNTGNSYTPNISSSTSYYLACYDSAGDCENTDRIIVEATVNPLPTAEATPQCAGDNLTYNLLVVTSNSNQLTASSGTVGGTAPNWNISGVNTDTDVTITVTNSNTGCSIEEVITSPVCAPPCSLGTPVIVVSCDNAGTPTIPGDDTFSYTINTSGTGTGSCYNISGGDTQTNVSYGSVSTSFGPFDISAGSLSITLTDCTDSGCIQTATVTAPSPCSNTQCPVIPVPTNPSNPTICEGEDLPSLTVDSESGLEVTWYDTDGSTVIVSNSTTYTPAGITAAGVYTYYTEADVSGNQNCPPSDRVPVTLTILENPSFEIEVGCVFPETNSYEVTVTISGGDQVIISDGNVNDVDPVYYVDGIPANTGITVTVTNSTTGCSYTEDIDPPTCTSCGEVQPPSNPNNPSICFGEDIPALTVDNSLLTNWYDSPTGGIALQSGVSTEFTPTGISSPGIYTYYAEAEDLQTGGICPESDRTEVTLTIYDNPQVSNATISQCDFSGGQEFYAFDLTSVEGDIVSGTGFTIAWYSDATLTTSITTPTNYLVSGNETVYAEVTDANNCSSVAEVSLFVNVYQPPIFATVCNNAGTPFDSSDDTFTFTLTIDGPIGVVYTFRGEATGSGQFQQTAGPFGPYPISGGDLDITIASGCDDLDLTIQAPDVCSQDCPTDNCLGITVTKTQN